MERRERESHAVGEGKYADQQGQVISLCIDEEWKGSSNVCLKIGGLNKYNIQDDKASPLEVANYQVI